MSANRPVVLVHGYLSAAITLVPIRRSLRNRGFDAHLVTLSPLCIGDVRRMAEQLDANVERIRAETGAEQVDVVGMSLGGLIGLWWLRHLGGHSRTARFVAVGSPFLGTWAALLGIATLGLVSRGAWQMLPNSALVGELQGPVLVPTTVISMTGDTMAPPSRCRLQGAKHVVLDGPPIPGIAHQTLVLSGRTIACIARALV